MDTKMLEDNGYVAAPGDIQAITQGLMDARAQSGDGSRTYLRALVGTTQDSLGIPPKRRGKIQPLDDAGRKLQLESLDKIHAAFYAEVMRVVQAVPLGEEDTGKQPRLVYDRRANFARSSKATLRAWLLSNNDLRSLYAGKVTKYGLRAEITRRVTVGRAPSEKQVVVAAEKIIVRAMKARDPAARVRLLEAVIERLVREIGVIGAANSIMGGRQPEPSWGTERREVEHRATA